MKFNLFARWVDPQFDDKELLQEAEQEENSSPCVKYDVSEKGRQDGAGGASRRSRRGGVKIKLFRSPVR